MADRFDLYYLPGRRLHARGLTRAECEACIRSHLCPACLEDLERGFVEYGDGDWSASFPVEEPSDTVCGDQWEEMPQLVKDLLSEVG